MCLDSGVCIYWKRREQLGIFKGDRNCKADIWVTGKNVLKQEGMVTNEKKKKPGS